MGNMNPSARTSWFALFLLVAAVGCEGVSSDRPDAKPKNKPAAKTKPVKAKLVPVAKNIELEVRGKERRVLIAAEVCLREGMLELFLCRKHTKEHEAILAADVDARKIHEALLLAGAEEGSPVSFHPKFRAASGTKIKISVQYKDKNGKLRTVSAQSWIKNMKTEKALDSDWVFAGSHLVDNPLAPGKKHYLANDGDVICVSNFETALLDLPIKSPQDAADLIFNAFTERIPPLETKVTVILEPLVKEKKDTK